ncbi:MAG: hypothetical protein ACLP1Q_15660 [Solirubrobacteraceae bacterium]
MLARLRAVDRAPGWVDSIGLRSLTVLSRNKLPPALAGSSEPPDELCERLTYRLLTHVFRFAGKDLGASARGKRAPDALLDGPVETAQPFSAVLDCKASRDGWSMTADDETRLANYVNSHRGELRHGEHPFLIVVSSAFPSSAAVFATRRAAIAERCGAHLVYLRATLLVAAGLKVEATRLSCEEREALPWKAYLAQHRPGNDIVAFANSGS